MPDTYHFLRYALIAALLPAIVAGKIGSAGPALTDQTLEAVRNCMARSPAPWPEEWKQEYLSTIRSAAEPHRDVPQCATRLEILRKGFATYWISGDILPISLLQLCRRGLKIAAWHGWRELWFLMWEHHVTQCGNRRQAMFFNEDDYRGNIGSHLFLRPILA